MLVLQSIARSISGFDYVEAGEFDLVIDPPIHADGQDVINMITGTWIGIADGCVMEGSDGTRFDLEPVTFLLWVCPYSGVVGASFHGDIEDDVDGRTFIFFGLSVVQVSSS